MTRGIMEDFGIVPSVFTQFEYNIMISLPDLKDHYLKNSSFVNREMEERDNLKLPIEERAFMPRKSIDIRSVLTRQTTNRSNQSGGTRIGEAMDRLNSQAEFTNDVTGFDVEKQTFGMIFRLPLNLAKILEDFSALMSKEPNNNNSNMQRSGDSKPSIGVRSPDKPSTSAPKHLSLNLVFSKLGASVNKKENEIVAYP